MRIDERTGDISRRLDELVDRWDKTTEDFEHRIRRLEAGQTRILAYAAALAAMIVEGIPLIRSWWHLP